MPGQGSKRLREHNSAQRYSFFTTSFRFVQLKRLTQLLTTQVALPWQSHHRHRSNHLGPFRRQGQRPGVVNAEALLKVSAGRCDLLNPNGRTSLQRQREIIVFAINAVTIFVTKLFYLLSMQCSWLEWYQWFARTCLNRRDAEEGDNMTGWNFIPKLASEPHQRVPWSWLIRLLGLFASKWILLAQSGTSVSQRALHGQSLCRSFLEYSLIGVSS